MICARRLALVVLNLGLGGAGYLVWIGEETTAYEQRTAALFRPPARAVVSGEDPASAGEAKPLFRIRPPAPVAIQDNPAPASPTAPNFRLAGVVWGDSEKVAIIQMTDDGKHRRVRLGETIGEWILTTLSARTALVEAGKNKMELTLKPMAGPH